jgi:drug/metabolite transporter (DMT)-like permease
MSENKKTAGHLAGLITVFFWGITYISTKLLLSAFMPVEILFFRFAIGFLALLAIYPRQMKISDIYLPSETINVNNPVSDALECYSCNCNEERILISKKTQELHFLAAGLCGITLYYLLENIALVYTLASNVGVIAAAAPFFTAIMAHFFLKGERLQIQFFIGFLAAMAGIFLITFAGSAEAGRQVSAGLNFDINPIGDILAIAATMVWAIYSVITRKISQFGYNTIQTTRRCFGYGLVFMLPVMILSGGSFMHLTRLSNPILLGNLLFLGIGASALCFVTWNSAVKILGAIKASVYIYLIPVITVVISAIVLHEKMTPIAIAGTILTLAGLFISEGRISFKNQR